MQYLSFDGPLAPQRTPILELGLGGGPQTNQFPVSGHQGLEAHT